MSLLISDVPGDDPSAIAFGPTVPDPTTFADARAVLARYGITSRRRRDARISSGPRTRRRSRAIRASPRVETIMIATPQMSLEAAAEVARTAG